MSFNTGTDSLTSQNDAFMAHFGNKINAGTADPISIRKQHYLDFTIEDFHYLYEICTSIIDTLSANGMNVQLGRSENRQINHRKLVKERIPKDYRPSQKVDAKKYANPTPGPVYEENVIQNVDTAGKKRSFGNN